MPSVRGLGRYEFKDEKSAKFWECLEDLDGTYLVRWGKIGAPKGQIKNQISWFEAERRILQKRRKGYGHIRGSATSLVERERRDLEANLPQAEVMVFVAPKRRL
jgi:predicted DNA-binding WGR domain protein